MNENIRIGVDIGGTFTDAVAITQQGLRVAKAPSQKEHPGQGVLAAINALNLDHVPTRFMHGTTLVTNMLLERKGSPTGFITTQGMRDIIHIGRHERPLTYAIRQEIPQQRYPPVPRRWRLTINERVSASGEIIQELNEDEVRQAARKLAEDGVEAIAIGFLHAYRYQEHERKAVRWIQDELPNLFVCASHAVSPRFREYERFLTTAWNARVAPGAAAYLYELTREIDRRWPGLKLTMVSSNGGLEEVDLATESVAGDLRRTPIRLSLSGPAAAGNAVAHVAKQLGISDCVGIDIGGTSTDIVVVRNGRLNEAPWEERRIAGYPLQIAMLDIHTIGAGGGSIVVQDKFGALQIGPRSAGAVPGPICYGRGGDMPTVTDAAVITGRLPGRILLGGKMSLQPELIPTHFRRMFQISDEADLIKIGLHILAVTESKIAFGIRERTVARGLNPSDLALVAAGGAGPLLSCGIAEILELKEVIVPPRPGLLAAWGLLVASDRREIAKTILQPLMEISDAQAIEYFEKAKANLPSPANIDATYRLTAALRYVGQGFEVEVDAPHPITVERIAQRFHRAHEKEYGFSSPNAPIEWVELRVSWEVAPPAWTFPEVILNNVIPETKTEMWELAKRKGDFVPVKREVAILDRHSLTSGRTIKGPNIVTEIDSTTYIPTGWTGTMIEGGYLRIRKNGK